MTTTPGQEKYDSATYRSRRKGVPTDTFSSNAPHRAPVLCYICGIEVPIQSASWTYGVWRIPEATITMFPDVSLQRFGAEDRVPVVLFWLDEYTDPAEPKWRLGFEGEIVGWSYSNSSAGRSLSFSCVADIAIFTQLFMFYMTTIDTVAQGVTEQPEQPARINQAAFNFPYALFRKGLLPSPPPKADGTTTDTDADYISRPYDLPYNVIRHLISSKVPEHIRCVPAVNFFVRWIRRQQFHNKWIALPMIEESVDGKPGTFPIFRAVQSHFAIQSVKALAHDIATQYQGGSVFTMLKAVLDMVFMEIAMLPTAALVKVDSTTGNIVGAPTKPVEYVNTSNVGPVPPPTAVSRLANYFVKPQFLFGLPPTCNVIFPSMTPEFTYQESYATQPTRLYLQDSSLVSLLSSQSSATHVDGIALVQLARAYPPEIDVKYQKKIDPKSPNGATTGKSVLVYPEEFFKGPVTSQHVAPPWLMYLAMQMKEVDPNTTAGKVNTTDPSKPLPTSSETSTPATAPPTSGPTEQSIYKLYAEYEYFRQRFEQRNGGVSCAFQPFVVPGFPLIVIDEAESRMHTFGYLMNVTQMFAPGQVSTQLNYSYGRTIYEVFDQLNRDMVASTAEELKNTVMAMSPPEPIPEVRNIIQHFHKCDQFYQSLFQLRPTEGAKKPAVFRYDDIFSFVGRDGKPERISFHGYNEEQVTNDVPKIKAAKELMLALQNDRGKQLLAKEGKISSEDFKKYVAAIDLATGGDVSAVDGYEGALNGDGLAWVVTTLEALEKGYLPENRKVSHNLSVDKELIPTPGCEPYFDSYDAAMTYCSRPICTLEEYIDFIGGVREMPCDDLAYSSGKGVPTLRYYGRIRRLTGATTKTKVTLQQTGVEDSGVSVPPDFPQMRAEWEKVLLAYRQSIYTVLKAQR